MEPVKAPLHVSSKCLGDGSSASVHIATLDGGEVAAKVSGVQEESRRQVRREARRYARLKHPGILRCLGVAETGGSVVLVTELMRGGSLFHALRARNGKLLPREQMIGMGIQIARALAFVHNSRFSSGDIKSLNVLLATPLEEVDENMPPDVKLCDFGLSRRLGGQGCTPKSEMGGNEFLWGTTVDMDPNAVAGTFAYLAPECFERPATTSEGMKKADVFALGVVLWELATCDIPWAGLTIGALMRVVREKRTLPFPDRVIEHVGNRYVQLVKKCWSNRPDATLVAVELESLFESCSPTGIAHDLYSDVSSNSITSKRVLGSAYSESSITSDESAAIVSITSVEDVDDGDHDGSFDISLTLFPDYAREIAEKQRLKQSESESDSDSSGEFHTVDDSHWDNGENVVVFGNVDDFVDIPLQEIEKSSPLPLSSQQQPTTEDDDNSTFYSTSSEENEEEDEFMEYGQVIEIDDDYKSPAASGVGLLEAPLGKRVHFNETLTTTFHVSSSLSHHEQQQQVSPQVPTRSISTTCEGGMAENNNDDGVYMPEEFSGAGPGFLDATNELSEFSFTFQDGSSHEGSSSHNSRTHGPRLKENIAESLEKRQFMVKQARAEQQHAAATKLPPKRRDVSPTPKRPATVPLRYSPLVRPSTYSPNKSSLQPPAQPVQIQRRRRAPVLRDYTSPPIHGAVLNQEIARFEDEDANTDVLTSVMQFSRFVQRRY